jgi:hypothetical protein
LRSTASLQRTAQVRLRSSVSRAPRIWIFLNSLFTVDYRFAFRFELFTTTRKTLLFSFSNAIKETACRGLRRTIISEIHKSIA